MKRATTVFAAFTMVIAACGGGDSEAPAATAPSTTSTPTTVTAPTIAPTTAAPTTAAPTTAAPTAAAPTTAAPTTAAPTTQPAVDLELILGGDPTDGWYPVLPGRYASNRVAPGLTLDVAERLWFDDLAGVILLRGDATEGNPAVVISNFVGVIPATEVGIHPPHSDDPVPANTEDLPVTLTDWIEATPQLILMGSGAHEVLGSPAEYWDLTVDAAAGQTFECQYGNCIAAMVSEELGNFVMGDSAHFRIYQLSGAGAGIYVWAEAQPDGFGAVGALAERIMAGFSLS